MVRQVMRSKRSERGFVYVISAPNGYVKIGSGSNPFERFSMIQTSSPLILSLAYVCECMRPVDVEEAVHRLLDIHRRHREWFEVAADRAIDAVRAILTARGHPPMRAPDRLEQRGERAVGIAPRILSAITENAIPAGTLLNGA